MEPNDTVFAQILQNAPRYEVSCISIVMTMPSQLRQP
jgi:hypothetical protein